MFQKAYRELAAGVRQQRHGTELLSKQLAETVGVGGAGAWPLTRQEGIGRWSVPIECYAA